MYKLNPYYTNDGSVGLFSQEDDDIYHSTYGALTEAYEKFILPADFKKFLENNNEVKILDICFGIGYNTKSFINYLLDFIYNDTIDTYNIKYINKRYTDNKKYKIFIHAIDKDKILANLSPFLKTYEKNIAKINSKCEIVSQNKKIAKMIAQKTNPKYKLKKEVNILLLKKIFNQIDNETIEILMSKKYVQFFDNDILRLFEFFKNERSSGTPLGHLSAFLHNIYYRYLSTCYKKALKALKLLDFNFMLEIEDARTAVKNDKNVYNFVFLDAFTPSKCPCLWTVDFFRLLFEHLDENGMILTYSNSANIRNAFLNAGFFVGKIFSKSSGRFTGTVAVKNKSLIKYELSEFDLGLLKTRAGIFYRDTNLNLNNEAIIEAHKLETANSDLMSSSQYIKQNNICCHRTRS